MTIPTIETFLVLHVKTGFETRADSIERQFTKHQLLFEYVLDWDIPDLTEEVLAHYFKDENSLTLAEKSLCMKHKRGLELIQERGDEFALIFEDDVILREDFTVRLESCLAEAVSFKGDSIVCIGNGCNLYTPRKRRETGVQLYEHNEMRAADSYVISAASATLILNYIEEFGFDLPYDHFISAIASRLGIGIYWLVDPIVEQGSQNGEFKTSLRAGKPLLYQKLHWKFERFRRKYLWDRDRRQSGPNPWTQS